MQRLIVMETESALRSAPVRQLSVFLLNKADGTIRVLAK